MKTRAALFAFVLLVAMSAAATEPAPGTSPLDGVSTAMNVLLKCAVLIVPVLIAFYRRDRDALSQLLAAVPNIWDVVQQERRKHAEGKPGFEVAATDAMKRALELAKAHVGRPLTAVETSRVTTALQAHHERMQSIGARATPVAVPTVGPVVAQKAPPPTAGMSPTTGSGPTPYRQPAGR